MAQLELQYVSIHGHEVSYRMGGDGPAILLIHGMAGSSLTWKEVMPLLARSYTVLAPDLLGHGESAKPLGDYSLGSFASGLRDFLAVVGVERMTVVGQSLGGGVAMQLAYQYPELCERLALVNSGGLGREVSWMLRLLTLPGAEFIMPVLFPAFVRDRGNDLSQFLLRKGLRAPRIAEMWRAYVSLAEPENRRAFVRTLRAVVDTGGQVVSAKDRLYLTVGMPTLIVWGDADHIIPVAHAYAAHEAMPGSRLEVFEGVGHFPHAEEPLRFAAVLTDFIETTRPALLGRQEFRELVRTRG
jgi:pimeloyl-ACP methyl ester carboxylesterase